MKPALFIRRISLGLSSNTTRSLRQNFGANTALTHKMSDYDRESPLLA